jgi:hypothetical protein
MNTYGNKIRSESCLWRCDAKIGNHRKAKAAPDRCTLNRGYDGLTSSKQANCVPIEIARVGKITGAGLRAVAVRASKPSTRTEHFALRAKHDGTQIGLTINIFQCIGQRVMRLASK